VRGFAAAAAYLCGMHALLPFLIALWMRPAPRPASAFETDVKPILQQRCVPCHFPGGKMYARLPFDRPETIVKLGEKLFTRIKDEGERAKIRKFLAAQRPTKPEATGTRRPASAAAISSDASASGRR
jgi:hypothetical protein